MASRKQIELRLKFWENALEEMQKAYLALVSGRVASYTIYGRQVTRLGIQRLLEDIREAEIQVDIWTAKKEGRGTRKAVGIVPQDW